MAVRPRVLLVEDQELMVETLRVALGLSGFDSVTSVEDLSLGGVLRAYETSKADVVLLDLHLSEDTTSISMIEPLTSRGAQVLMLTASRERLLLAECLEAGAAGIFDKTQSFHRLVEFIEDAAVGRSVLSPEARSALLAALRDHRAEEHARALPFATLSGREREVLKLMTEGESAEAIAERLYVSLATVRTHVRAILRKLGVNSQLAAVVLAERAGWSGGEGSRPGSV